jgi:hypothetical protein
MKSIFGTQQVGFAISYRNRVSNPGCQKPPGGFFAMSKERKTAAELSDIIYRIAGIHGMDVSSDQTTRKAGHLWLSSRAGARLVHSDPLNK